MWDFCPELKTRRTWSETFKLDPSIHYFHGKNLLGWCDSDWPGGCDTVWSTTSL